jgi:hypothetical protein
LSLDCNLVSGHKIVLIIRTEVTEDALPGLSAWEPLNGLSNIIIDLNLNKALFQKTIPIINYRDENFSLMRETIFAEAFADGRLCAVIRPRSGSKA